MTFICQSRISPPTTQSQNRKKLSRAPQLVIPTATPHLKIAAEERLILPLFYYYIFRQRKHKGSNSWIMFFQKKRDLNDVDLARCNPVVVNQTQQSIVVFMDRGFLYNKQVLAPGEAIGMTREETGDLLLPYKIHAVVGDEKALPTRRHSMTNMISTAVIPTAFIVGTFMAASSAGTMTGPSLALKRAAGGLVIKGMVIDSAALAAGSLAASKATMIAEKLIKEKPKNYFCKSGHCMPGRKFVAVRGGIDSPLSIHFLREKEFRQIEIVAELKTPMDTIEDKWNYYLPTMLQSTKSKRQSMPALENNPVQCQLADERNPEVTNYATSAAVTRTESPSGPSAPPEEKESEEEMIRLAIEASLKLQEEEEQKRLQAARTARDKRTCVTLF
jgi:hypothetical protein